MSQYKQIETEVVEVNITNIELPIVQGQDQDGLAKAITMLKNWGKYNRYSSQCGYKRTNVMFKSLYPTHDWIFIENEIEFIDTCMRKSKLSKSALEKQQQQIAELYYRGVDVVLDGKDWSEKLTIRQIAARLDMTKSTVSRRLNAFESYIVSELAKSNAILY